MLLQPRLLVECRAGTNGCRAERPLFGCDFVLLLLDNDNYVLFDRKRCEKGTRSIQSQSAVKRLGTISVEEEFPCEGGRDMPQDI
jgi:hypothetical protein